jgi:hypothetical protein
VAAPSANRINKRAAKDKAFLARALKNPGLRAKLDPKFLSAPQRASRTLNARLNAPIVPGSSTTERDLAHEAQAAQTVRYGPQDAAIRQQLGVAQQTERDTGSLYDQYRAALQQHSASIQAFQAGAQQALGALQQGVTGLGQQSAVQMAQAAAPTQSAVAAPSADLATLANQALAVRQGQAGTFGAEQALTGAAANTYADTQANVVAPGQKLGALAQARGRTRDVRQKQADLATEKGAFNQQFRTERRADEFKNQLAVQTLGANVAQDQAQAQVATQRVTETKRHNQTAEQIAKARNKTAAKTAQQKADLAAGKVNQYGYTDAAWRAMSTAQRQRVIKDFKASSKSSSATTTSKEAFRAKYGVDPQPTAAHNRARDDVQNAQAAFGQVGKITTRKDGSKKRVTTDEVVSVLRNGGTSNVLIRAALEIRRYGHITPGTAARLHKAGYSVATLGFKTGPARGGGSGSQTTRPGSGPATARPS